MDYELKWQQKHVERPFLCQILNTREQKLIGQFRVFGLWRNKSLPKEKGYFSLLQILHLLRVVKRLASVLLLVFENSTIITLIIQGYGTILK